MREIGIIFIEDFLRHAIGAAEITAISNGDA
jgi:hypothetical protein